MMPVTLGTHGQPGFDRPFELLSDCHRRIEQFLAVIRRALAAYSSRELDEECSNALRTAQRYFREGAPRHTEDEEVSLFPRLRDLDRDDLRELVDAAERLEREHDEAKRIHHSVDARIDRWLRDRRLMAAEVEWMVLELDALDRLYAEHIAFEDHVLFPAAARALDREDVLRIGEEMAARRGLDVGGTEPRENIEERRSTR